MSGRRLIRRAWAQTPRFHLNLPGSRRDVQIVPQTSHSPTDRRPPSQAGLSFGLGQRCVSIPTSARMAEWARFQSVISEGPYRQPQHPLLGLFLMVAASSGTNTQIIGAQ